MGKIIKDFKSKILKHELVSGSIFIFSGSIFGNILAFFLNLFLARNLSYGDYAIFASLLSIITLVAIPAGSINTVIVKFATQLFVKKQNKNLKVLYLFFFKFIIGLSIFIVLFFILLSVPIRDYLKIDNIWYVIFSGAVIATFYLNVLNSAFLQSLLKFKLMALINIVGSILKLTVGVVLVYLGFRVFGGLGGLFSMMFGMYLVAYFPLAKILKEKSSDKKINLNIKKMFSYAVPAFIAMLSLTSFISTDLILVKHFYSPQMAGYYAGLSLVGRVVYYFTFPISTVMFPILIKRHAKGIAFNNIFYLSLLFVIVPSLVITTFYSMFPNFVTTIFLGGREYLQISKFLGIFGLYLTVYSLVNVCVNFFLSLNKTKISILVVLAALLQIILIYIFHSNFYQVIGVSLFTLFLLLVTLLFIFFKNYANFGKIQKIPPVINLP